MKLLVILAACVAICASSAIPTVPGDNSHYVEGESRYIWMGDGAGNPVLVDLQEPVDYSILNDPTRNGANNQYWLFTRSNQNSAQVIVNGNANSLSSSNFVASRQTKFIVHGWNNNGNSEVNTMLRAEFLNRGDFNVIVVDWRALASSGYATAVAGVPSVGQHIGNFMAWIVGQTGTSWNNFHIMGFSLGAHIAGNAGRQAGNRCARLTGLDPAGPSWSGNSNAMRASDAVYVEAIHTDAGLLGITDAVANADFYPNGGRNPQPGCLISTCSHGRSYQLMAATVRNNHLVGRLCGNLNAALNNQCLGSNLNMGNHIINKWGSGIFGLSTGNSFPY